ncbi:MAG: HAD family phosphatase [Proteobacteria bacterium]|nr:HAD family phosphatase [Pseudomonadota bacterium]
MKAINLIVQSSVVLLDFDGVIVDSENWQIKAWNTAIEEMKISIEGPISIAGILDEEIALSIAKSKSVANRLLQTKNKIFVRLFDGQNPPLVPGVLQFIKLYSKIGIIGVTSNSNKSRLMTICEYYGLNKYLSIVEGARGKTAPKPSPEIYNLVLNKLKKSAAQAVAIEDSIPGLIAAKSANVKAIGLPTSCLISDLIPKADAVFESFDTLMHQWKELKTVKLD